VGAVGRAHGDHENDQQHQQYIAQRDDIHINHRAAAVTRTECHVCLSPGLVLQLVGRHEADLAHALGLRNVDHLVDGAVLGGSIGTDVHRWLRGFLRFN